MKLKEAIQIVLSESKSDTLKKLDGVLAELEKYIASGEIEREELNDIVNGFSNRLEKTRKKFTYNKVSPAVRTAAIEKGKATRDAKKASDADRKAKRDAAISAANKAFDDGILPASISFYAGEEPEGLETYYAFRETHKDDGRGGGGYPDSNIYKLKKQYVGKKVGAAVLKKFGIEDSSDWIISNEII